MKLLIFAVSLIFISQNGLAKSIKASSTAMWPTYSKGTSMTSIKIFSPNEIRRGDIILFQSRLDNKWLLDKRVIAIPGDTIEIKNKFVYLNGSLLKREPSSKLETTKLNDRLPENLVGTVYQYFRETNDKANYIIGINPSETLFTNFAKIKIPEGEFFVMGDNRDASKDSRSDGTVQFEKIQGIIKH
jgi:signal peptidase I